MRPGREQPEFQAAGKTTIELQNDIVRQMSRLNTRVSQAVVRVIDYQYQYVFVKGQVLNPGKLTFEEIPDLWTIINEAGGITETGDLTRVTIIRGGTDAGKIEAVKSVISINKALEAMVQLVEADIAGRKPVRISVFHALAEEKAKALLESTAERLHADEAILSYVSPVVGCHVGPGTLSIAYMAGM